MAERSIDGFFYGLFMDAQLLRQSGIEPRNPRRAYLDGYALRIGQRATLVRRANAQVWGMAFTLTCEEMDWLYAAPGLEAYRPEAILARSEAGESWPALCYNLPEVPERMDVNADYIARLRVVLRELDFPKDYINSI